MRKFSKIVVPESETLKNRIRGAVALQEEMRSKICIEPLNRPIRTVAGLDLAFDPKTLAAVACALVFKLPSLEIIETVWARGRLDFPYVPGLLSFREAPLLMEAIRKLSAFPDVFIFDGQGIAHPRRLGIASHIGLLLDHASVGCAKSKLVGTYQESELALRGQAELYYQNRIVGAVLTTRPKTRPVFVSPGHKIGIDESVSLIRACCDGYRIPKPTRAADRLVGRLKHQEP